jgi:hypothetical protein
MTVCTGRSVLVWGGRSAGVLLKDGAMHDVASDKWSPMAAGGAHGPRGMDGFANAPLGGAVGGCGATTCDGTSCPAKGTGTLDCQAGAVRKSLLISPVVGFAPEGVTSGDPREDVAIIPWWKERGLRPDGREGLRSSNRSQNCLWAAVGR